MEISAIVAASVCSCELDESDEEDTLVFPNSVDAPGNRELVLPVLANTFAAWAAYDSACYLDWPFFIQAFFVVW